MAPIDGLADQPISDGVRPRPGGRPRTLLRLVVGGVFLAVIVVVLADQWQQAWPLLGRLSVPAVLAASTLVLAGILATFCSWRAALAALGATPPLHGALRIFYLGQLGKYLPGSIWPAVTQMRLGRDYRVPPRASGAAFLVFMLLVIGTGLLVGVPMIPLLGRHAAESYRWLVLALPVAMLAVAPPVLNRVLAVALRLARRPPLPTHCHWPASCGSPAGQSPPGCATAPTCSCSPANLGLREERCCCCSAPGRSRPPSPAAYCWCWCRPGSGREAALLLLLGSTVTAPRAAVVAVVSRLLFVLGDLAWAAVALVAPRQARTHTRAARR